MKDYWSLDNNRMLRKFMLIDINNYNLVDTMRGILVISPLEMVYNQLVHLSKWGLWYKIWINIDENLFKNEWKKEKNKNQTK